MKVVRCWTTMDGQIMCADERFGDWFGKRQLDISGKMVTSLLAEQEELLG
jgi:hypothetical protein